MDRYILIVGLTCCLLGASTHLRAADPPVPVEKQAVSPDLYHEALRPQYHFSAKKGWLNDPNGLVYFRGQYQLFFQHTPQSLNSGAKYWGHAVSPDLVHWTEIAEALAPDAAGDIWSGSAVVDWLNSSGFGQGGQPPLVLIYTAAPIHDVEHGQTSVAYSNDGVRCLKYAGNPVLGDLKLTNRDPRVFWYEPGKHWVLALFVEENGHNNMRFYTSTDLRHWTFASQFAGGSTGGHGVPRDNFLFECPDIWEMPVEGEPMTRKWIISAANTEYMVGSFDGKSFTSESAELPGQKGSGYYAPQTFNSEPKGRRVRLGWLQTAAPGMPFNQSMSLPSELKLVRTPAGLRLAWSPVSELESLRRRTYLSGPRTLQPNDANPLSQVDTDLLEIRAEFVPPPASKTTFTIRGVPVSYDAAKGELNVQGKRVLTPLVDGKLRLIIYADRLSLEVYASDGLTYVPAPVVFNPADRSAAIAVEGEPVRFDQLDVYELQSAWPQ